MSQSPIDELTPDASLSYRKGWRVLNRLLREGRSFSGHERNCVFLNTGQGPFADISAASGADFADDGRAIALSDWDFDGDVDLWITNRTAPRVRWLRNENPRRNHFLAVRLQGNGLTTNRDAIGARVELVTSGAATRKLIRTLRAGEGFLAQNSKWIHFGLGQQDTVQRLVVHWPGGKSETFGPLEVDRHYRIVQQSGKAIEYQPPTQQTELTASVPSLPTSTQRARIVLPDRLPLPEGKFTDPGGKQMSFDVKDRPLLLNLWASWCQPCVKELSDWTDHEAELRSAGLDVVALSVEAPETADDPARALLARLKFPFRSGRASETLVRDLNLFQRAVLDLWRPLPVPSSFLLDRQGRVAVIYKGPVSADQLLSDLQLLDLPAEALRKKAVPFAGRWRARPPQPDPNTVSDQFIDHGLVPEAIAYLRRFAAGLDPTRSSAERSKLADIDYLLGIMLRQQKRPDEAIAILRQAALLDPNDFRIQSELGELELAAGNLDSAAKHLTAALRIKPDALKVRTSLAVALISQQRFGEAIKHFTLLAQAQPDRFDPQMQLAEAYRAAGKVREAVPHYKAAIRIRPAWPALNNLAWLMATHSDTEVRDGKVAVTLAERAAKEVGDRQLVVWDTLAAAYAEAGRFDMAAKAIGRAIEMAQKRQLADRLNELEARSRLYKSGKPYHDRTP